MKSQLKGYLSALAIALTAVSSAAHAVFYTSDTDFLAANPGLTLQDYEGIAPAGSFATITPTGFSVVGTSYILSSTYIDGDVPPDLPGDSPSDYLCAPCEFGKQVDITFDSPVSAFGFNLAIGRIGDLVGGGALNINLFDTIGTPLDSQSLTVTGLSQIDSYAGFSGFGATISRVTVDLATVNPAIDFTVIDNFSFGTPLSTAVPVPAAVWLFGSGLLGMVGVARRRANRP